MPAVSDFLLKGQLHQFLGRRRHGGKALVWIVKRARDEHKQAIGWLNQHTDENIGFFLIEIELWRIGDSLPAPRFNVVERPNEWAKTVKAAETLTPLRKFQLNFWQQFCDYAFDKDSRFSKSFSCRKAFATNWYNLSTGVSSVVVEFTIADCQAKCNTFEK